MLSKMLCIANNLMNEMQQQMVTKTGKGLE